MNVMPVYSAYSYNSRNINQKKTPVCFGVSAPAITSHDVNFLLRHVGPVDFRVCSASYNNAGRKVIDMPHLGKQVEIVDIRDNKPVSGLLHTTGKKEPKPIGLATMPKKQTIEDGLQALGFNSDEIKILKYSEVIGTELNNVNFSDIVVKNLDTKLVKLSENCTMHLNYDEEGKLITVVINEKASNDSSGFQKIFNDIQELDLIRKLREFNFNNSSIKALLDSGKNFKSHLLVPDGVEVQTAKIKSMNFPNGNRADLTYDNNNKLTGALLVKNGHRSNVKFTEELKNKDLKEEKILHVNVVGL